MPWEQEKKDAAVEEKPITKKKKGYWKKYEIDTIERMMNIIRRMLKAVAGIWQWKKNCRNALLQSAGFRHS